jgi:1-acyl-sn-glycerol-3-phosphate acyltransferase
MVNSKHNTLIYSFFKIYTLWKISRSFRRVIITGEYNEDNKAILLISNHFSWWDGFWAMYLNLKIFRRKFHFMMLEEQLEKFWFFKYTGGYPVRKRTRSILESINYTIELLSVRQNLVLLFPQGRLESLYKNSITFEKGVSRIASAVAGKAQVIFVVNLVDYLSESKPSLCVYLKEFTIENQQAEGIEPAYNAFLSECISEQIKSVDD